MFWDFLQKHPSVSALIGLTLGALFVIFTSGCEMGISATAGGKAFYPEKKLGDPRVGMYSPGYTEENGAVHRTGFTSIGGE